MDAEKLTLKQMFVLLRALDNSALSSDAKDLLIHFMVNQGEDWIHHEGFITHKKGWYHRRYMLAKKELTEAGLIESSFVYENRKRNGCKIIVNYDWTYDAEAAESCKVPICNVTNSNVTQSDFTCSTKVTICNVTPSNGTPSNVTNSDALISKKSKIKEENALSSKKSRSKEENQKRKLKEKSAHQTTQQPFTASEYTEDYLNAPEDPSEISFPAMNKPEEDHSATFEELFGPDELMTKKPKAKKKKDLTLKFTPPSQEEIRNYIEKSIKSKKDIEKYWTPEQISDLAGEIWNYYESVNWKVGNKIMEKWHNAVSGWCYRQNWMPKGRRTQNIKTFKELEREAIDRPVTHQEQGLIEGAAFMLLKTNFQAGIAKLPEHLRQPAIDLAKQMQKEQGDKPKASLIF